MSRPEDYFNPNSRLTSNSPNVSWTKMTIDCIGASVSFNRRRRYRRLLESEEGRKELSAGKSLQVATPGSSVNIPWNPKKAIATMKPQTPPKVIVVGLLLI